MIRLVDILGIKKEDYNDYKIHFAIGGGKDKHEPYNQFLIDKFELWQEQQRNKNFKKKYIISLIYYEKDTWLFAGVYKVNGKPTPYTLPQWNGYMGWKYDTILLDNQKDLIGRMFIEYKKGFRASYPSLELAEDMVVGSITKERVSISDFEGFDKVNITNQMLNYIVSSNIPSWKSALSKVKGIYLIVDTITGKQYVGSAYGDDCIWQRWSQYAKNGHGGNIELKELLKQKGEDYKNNFKYSILEVCNMNLGTEYIISRENYWKNILMTKEFGLNKN